MSASVRPGPVVTRPDTEAWLDHGDPDGAVAFADLYRRHHARIERLCRFRLGDTYEAEDVAQEAFVRAWRSPPPGASDAEMGRWLSVVAGNLCTDVLRKRKRAASANERIAAPELHDGTEDAGSGMVEQALDDLSPRYRAVLVMRDAHGLSHQEIASRLGTSRAGVESTLWRARRALRAKFVALVGPGGYLAGLPLVGYFFRGSRPTQRGQNIAARVAGILATDAPGAAWTLLCGATAVAGLLGASPATASANRSVDRPSIAKSAVDLHRAPAGGFTTNRAVQFAPLSSASGARQPALSGTTWQASGAGLVAAPSLPNASVPSVPTVNVNTETNPAMNLVQSETNGLPVKVDPTRVESDAPTAPAVEHPG